jgi:hypothetical protein
MAQTKHMRGSATALELGRLRTRTRDKAGWNCFSLQISLLGLRRTKGARMRFEGCGQAHSGVERLPLLLKSDKLRNRLDTTPTIALASYKSLQFLLRHATRESSYYSSTEQPTCEQNSPERPRTGWSIMMRHCGVQGLRISPNASSIQSPGPVALHVGCPHDKADFCRSKSPSFSSRLCYQHLVHPIITS